MHESDGSYSGLSNVVYGRYCAEYKYNTIRFNKSGFIFGYARQNTDSIFGM